MSDIKHSKKLSKNREKIESKILSGKTYTIDESVKILKEVSFTNFDQTVEVVMNLGVDPRHSDQMVRGIASMPSGTGKNVKVAVICKDTNSDIAKEAGADRVGAEDLIDEIKSGKIEYDIYITTPDMMSLVSRVARILGPKGLMPNPKIGTVTTDIAKSVKNTKSGQVEFKVDKNGIIHAGVGKLSFDDKDIISNIKSLTGSVVKARPSGAKGNYVKSVHLSSTMGPGISVDLASLEISSKTRG